MRCNENITDDEFDNLYEPYLKNVKDYVVKYVIPEVISFELSNFYYRGLLDRSNNSLQLLYGSMKDLFNVSCSLNDNKQEIEDLLKIKYNLKVVNENPLVLEKWNM